MSPGPEATNPLNAVLLGTLLYRSRLVPRLIPTLGLVGAPLLFAANIATLFGNNEQTSGTFRHLEGASHDLRGLEE